MMLTTEMTRCLEDATFLAANLGQREIEVWHVAVALLSDAEVTAAIRSLGADPELALGRIMSRHGADPKSDFNWDESAGDEGPMPSTDVTTLVRVSIEYARKRNCDKVSPVVLLRSILRFNGGIPGQVLTGLGISSVGIDGWLDRQERAKALRARAIPDELREYCKDLVIEALDGRLDPVVGREAQISRIGSILRRRKKNNPMLIGEPGVGKTAVVEGLARLIAEGQAGRGLDDARILALDVAKIIGGTKHRGDLEQRLQAILEHLDADRSLILFIDETHVIVGGTSGMADAGNLLKPALASGRIRCVGATTHGEYAKYFDADPALARRFVPVDVPEPTSGEALEILQNMVPEYSRHHGVTYQPEAVRAAVDLSVRYVLARRLPDKALDALDEAGALASRRKDDIVTRDHVAEALSATCGPAIAGGSRDADSLLEAISSVVRGQDAACRAVSSAIARSSSPLAAQRGVRSALMVSGGIGTGKELLARRLADALGLTVHRLDMSEFRQEHTVSRLIGPPPGYVGFGSGGKLTEIARRNPSCLIFLDRMEMAHPDVHAVIGQAIEHGFLTDTSERVVSFRGTIIVMAVRTEEEEAQYGFVSSRAVEASWGLLERSFGKDFLETLDLVVPLAPIGGQALITIANDLRDALVGRLTEKGIDLTVDPSLLAGVADEVLALAAGARPMARVFRKRVEDPVIEAAIAQGGPARGTRWNLTADGVLALQPHQQEVEAA